MVINQNVEKRILILISTLYKRTIVKVFYQSNDSNVYMFSKIKAETVKITS